MACLTLLVLMGNLIFLAGILSPGWVRVTQETGPESSSNTNSSSYGLFFYLRCTKAGCLTNMIYDGLSNHSYQGESLYPRLIATEFHACVACVLNIMALFTTKCSTTRNTGSSKSAFTTLILLVGSFFVTFNLIAEYLIIYLLARRTSIDYIYIFPYETQYVISRVQTPYSLIITSVGLLLQTFIIVYFIGKILSLLNDSSGSNEVPPPPYQSFRGGRTQDSYDPSNVTQRPVVCNSTGYRDDYTSTDVTRPLLGPAESPYHYGTRSTRSPVPSAPGGVNPFGDECDQ